MGLTLKARLSGRQLRLKGKVPGGGSINGVVSPGSQPGLIVTPLVPTFAIPYRINK